MLGKQAKIVSPDTLRRMPIIHVKPVSPSATPSSCCCRSRQVSGPAKSPGMLMSSTSETDALAGVTVLFEVGSWSPHHGCQG